MKGKARCPLLLPLFLFACLGSLEAQSSGTPAASSASQAFLSPGAPLWLRDLRRGEIVAFGSFPFTFFISAFMMDSYRASQNNWDTRYAPWPLKSAGAVTMTEDEFLITLSAAAGGAVLVSILDHIIVRIKRDKAAQAAARLPLGDPIIIRKPWPEGEGASSAGESGAP
ncbi:MAG: hypothetical protein LBD37_04885 [Treponema sp.]|nr:hypothetical protein [Treponema sp.]